MRISEESYGYDLLRPKSTYLIDGLIHQYPIMNNNLVISIQRNQLNIFAVDTNRMTAAAWCLNNGNQMVISDDAFLTFEGAKSFCQLRNATIWIPQSNEFLEDPDFFIEFESRPVTR